MLANFSGMAISKSMLRDHCVALLQARINSLWASMNAAQEAANAETKSSAGDKYETARAMNQLEKDMLGRQLSENKRELAAMMEVDCSGVHTKVAPGSLVECTDMYFFVLGGIGKLVIEDKTVWVISPSAPLARTLIGKTTGDQIIFNGKQITILELY